MGYFDYLESANTVAERENRYFDTYANRSFWFGVGSFGAMLVAILLFCFITIGSVIWLDFVMAAGLGVGITGLVFAGKARKIAKRNHKTTILGNFSFVWGLLFVIIDVLLVVMNTWIYFA